MMIMTKQKIMIVKKRGKDEYGNAAREDSTDSPSNPPPSPQIVLPSKAIKNERILETLMFQANSGMYRINDSYLEACQQRLQKQDSKFSEWESFDYGL